MKFKKLYKLVVEQSDEDFEMDLSFLEDAIDSASQHIFTLTWANWMDFEVPRNHPKFVSFMGMDLEDIAPIYTQFLTKEESKQLEEKISEILTRFQEANGNKDMRELYEYALSVDGLTRDDVDRHSTPEMFAYLVIMKCLGHGVSWEDDHKSPNFRYPHTEISYHEFPESFPTNLKQEEEDVADWEREGEEWRGEDYRDTSDDWKNN
jgi:hypothetical protein